MTTELKPVRHLKASAYRNALARRVASYEVRYEVPTARMRKMVMLGERPETAEIAKWLLDANALELLRTPAKNTAGSVSTPPKKSTNGR